MNEVFFKHKETGQLISLERLNQLYKDHSNEGYVTLCLPSPGFTFGSGHMIETKQYLILGIPFSDDFEVLTKPIFTEAECMLLYGLVSYNDTIGHPMCSEILTKLNSEIKRHQDYTNKCGGRLDEI